MAPLYRVCRACGEVDRDTKLCEGMTSDHSSRWSRYGTCGLTATFESPYKPSLLHSMERDGQTHNYCKTHDPETAKAKRDARDEASRDKYRVELEGNKWGWYGGALKKAAGSYLEWAAKNEDLVEGDEWLKQITASIRVAISKG